jgi:hypothetical protein
MSNYKKEIFYRAYRQARMMDFSRNEALQIAKEYVERMED